MKDFAKNSIIMVTLTTVASAINYLCQILMGRLLSPTAFGIMNSLFSAILVLSVPATSLTMTVTRQVAVQDDGSSTHEITRPAVQICVWCGSLYCAAAAAAAAIVRTDSLEKAVLLLAGAVVCAGLFPYIISGVLAGRRAFWLAGIFSLIVPVFKMGGIGASLLTAGDTQRQMVILGAMLLGNLAAIVAARGCLALPRWRETFPLPKTDGATASVIACNFIYLLFANADIFLITVCLGGETAGYYSAVMMFGRVVFYFTTALVSVVLPYVSMAHGSGGDPVRIFRLSLYTTLLVAGLCIVPLLCAPTFFIRLLYGEKYLSAAAYMLPACLIAVLVSALNLEWNYYIGVREEKRVLRDFACALLLLTILVALRRGCIDDILLVLTVVLLGLFLAELKGCLQPQATRGQKKKR